MLLPFKNGSLDSIVSMKGLHTTINATSDTAVIFNVVIHPILVSWSGLVGCLLGEEKNLDSISSS